MRGLIAIAEMSLAYIDHRAEDTWDTLAELYEDINKKEPSAEDDLLSWFFNNYDFDEASYTWRYIKELLN